MGLLIGRSGHGADIWHTLPNQSDWSWISHHKYFDRPLYTPPLIIGINDPHRRAAVCDDLDIPDDAWIHPNAYLGPDCHIGWGTHINYNASMTRTTLGVHTTIGPGVTIGGNVDIGDRCFVGMGALIGVPHPGESIVIGDDATIGAGALVMHDINPGETWVGVPAWRLS